MYYGVINSGPQTNKAKVAKSRQSGSRATAQRKVLRSARATAVSGAQRVILAVVLTFGEVWSHRHVRVWGSGGVVVHTRCHRVRLLERRHLVGRSIEPVRAHHWRTGFGGPVVLCDNFAGHSFAKSLKSGELQ